MCGELSKAVAYTSVNATVNKEQRERILDGGLFAWKCPSCGYSARLTYPILYNDMKNRFMIYLIPKIDRFQLCDKELEEKYSNLRNINKRVVADFNSFKEKIFIFESGLDDMAVELTKAVIGQTVSKKLDGTEVKEGYLSMYDRESNTMGFTYFTGEEMTPYVQTARLEISKSTRNGRTIFSTATSAQEKSKDLTRSGNKIRVGAKPTLVAFYISAKALIFALS